ncbi:hypothetical protein VFPBJ_11104 [Purpureocillium lilacinum]|uniref:Uncharacterized protein n=1 Tax=Purpureocillium lilacinum TaxID=33203 RepID=A0A179FKG5_PURLI|nr:hypothetical protein VFPBJ_11104 [Purpureocillium lilacinum]
MWLFGPLVVSYHPEMCIILRKADSTAHQDTNAKNITTSDRQGGCFPTQGKDKIQAVHKHGVKKKNGWRHRLC